MLGFFSVTQDRDIYVSELPKIRSNESISTLAVFLSTGLRKVYVSTCLLGPQYLRLFDLEWISRLWDFLSACHCLMQQNLSPASWMIPTSIKQLACCLDYIEVGAKSLKFHHCHILHEAFKPCHHRNTALIGPAMSSWWLWAHLRFARQDVVQQAQYHEQLDALLHTICFGSCHRILSSCHTIPILSSFSGAWRRHHLGRLWVC